MVRCVATSGWSLSMTPAAAIDLQVDESPAASMPPPSLDDAQRRTEWRRRERWLLTRPSRTTRAALSCQSSPSNIRAPAQGKTVAHTVSVTLRRLARHVGIEAAMAGKGLDEAIEGHDQRQRIGQRMAGGDMRQRAAHSLAMSEVMKTRRALAGQAVGGSRQPTARRHRGRPAPAPGSQARPAPAGHASTSAAL